MLNEKNQLIQVTTENYQVIINQYSYLLNKILKPDNLPLLFLIGIDWKTHGDVQNIWLKQKHGKFEEQIFLTEEELKKQIEVIKNSKLEKQFIEILGVFRKSNGQVLIHTLESILVQNSELILSTSMM